MLGVCVNCNNWLRRLKRLRCSPVVTLGLLSRFRCSFHPESAMERTLNYSLDANSVRWQKSFELASTEVLCCCQLSKLEFQESNESWQMVLLRRQSSFLLYSRVFESNAVATSTRTAGSIHAYIYTYLWKQQLTKRNQNWSRVKTCQNCLQDFRGYEGRMEGNSERMRSAWFPQRAGTKWPNPNVENSLFWLHIPANWISMWNDFKIFKVSKLTKRASRHVSCVSCTMHQHFPGSPNLLAAPAAVAASLPQSPTSPGVTWCHLYQEFVLEKRDIHWSIIPFRHVGQSKIAKIGHFLWEKNMINNQNCGYPIFKQTHVLFIP